MRNNEIEAQSLVILILVGILIAFVNLLLNLDIDFEFYLLFFIAWRVMVLEAESRKQTHKFDEWFRS